MKSSTSSPRQLTLGQEIACLSVMFLGLVTTIVTSLLGMLYVAFPAMAIFGGVFLLWRRYRPYSLADLELRWRRSPVPPPRDIVDRQDR